MVFIKILAKIKCMEHVFEKVGIIYNQDIEESKAVALNLKEKIKNSSVFSMDEMNKNINLAIVIGGDGTFLKAARFFSSTKIPILGLNLGRLGYLAQAKPDDIDEVIEKISKKDFTIENRLMLKANNSIALNDIVVKGSNCARSATLDLYINNKKLCYYVADGIIISTPTGSTAYSLSAGGPIVSPDIDCFLIIPICPHTLNTRPIVIPSFEKIIIKASEKNQKLNVSFDGQVDRVVDEELKIEKNENFAKLIILNQQKDKFYDILKEKLHWSLSFKR